MTATETAAEPRTATRPMPVEEAEPAGATILLTGATGFVGGHVAHELRASERAVRCLVRNPERAGDLKAWGCDIAQGDVTDPTSVRRALEGCEVVVHLVAIRQGKEEAFRQVMSEATRDLASAAKDAGVRRFVLMSALGTSEQTRDLVPYYGAKWEMEQAVKSSGLEYVIFRPCFIFAREGGILGTFGKLARRAPITPITGPGTQRIQPIWIDDVARYFDAAIDEPAAANRTFEIGGPDVVTWNEFWDRLKRVLGKRRPSVHMPMWFMRANAVVTERLPGNIPLTRDLLTMLEGPDNVVSNDDAVQTFGFELVSLDEQLRRAA